MAAGWLYRFLLVFTGRGDLGLSQRDLSQPRARERPEPGQLLPLVHECGGITAVPDLGSIVPCSSIRVLCMHGCAAVLCCAVLVPRNARCLVGRHAKTARNRVT